MKTRLTLLATFAAAWFLISQCAMAGTPNGTITIMPAYYDDQLFSINFMQLSPKATAALLTHNASINFIYQCDTCEGQVPGGMFTTVLDAIQGGGFNPLWAEVQITFNGSNLPQQFTSDNDILAAAMAGTITLTPTGEVYRCSVVGSKR